MTRLAPLLSVARGREAIEFYVRAFGAHETFRTEDAAGQVVATLRIGDAEFWVADEAPDHAAFSPESVDGPTARMILTVDDPDAVTARAIAMGAHEVWPVADRYGWRLGRIVDPAGHHWEIGRPLSDPDGNRSADHSVCRERRPRMPEEPNKPDGQIEADGEARPVEDRQAVKNQGEVKPEDYPEPASGDDTGGVDR